MSRWLPTYPTLFTVPATHTLHFTERRAGPHSHLARDLLRWSVTLGTGIADASWHGTCFSELRWSVRVGTGLAYASRPGAKVAFTLQIIVVLLLAFAAPLCDNALMQIKNDLARVDNRRWMRLAALLWRESRCAAHLGTAIWWRDLPKGTRAAMRCCALRWRATGAQRHLSNAINYRERMREHGTKT